MYRRIAGRQRMGNDAELTVDAANPAGLLTSKRVYRIYFELELNMRIKPRKRLKREKPEELAVPDHPTRCGRWTSWRIALKTCGPSGC